MELISAIEALELTLQSEEDFKAHYNYTIDFISHSISEEAKNGNKRTTCKVTLVVYRPKVFYDKIEQALRNKGYRVYGGYIDTNNAAAYNPYEYDFTWHIDWATPKEEKEDSNVINEK